MPPPHDPLIRGKFLLLAVALVAVGSACRRAPAPAPANSAASAPTTPKSTPELRVVSSENGTATWYDPAEDSRVAQRAPGELTAASDRLPMGSTVRVRNLANARSVLVRITDRGVHRAHSIDLCKDAATVIGLVEKGAAKVRIEQFADADKVSADRRP